MVTKYIYIIRLCVHFLRRQKNMILQKVFIKLAGIIFYKSHQWINQDGDILGFVGKLIIIYMRFGKCMGVIGVRLYEVWEVYGDPRGSQGAVYMRFGKCVGTPWGGLCILFLRRQKNMILQKVFIKLAGIIFYKSHQWINQDGDILGFVGKLIIIHRCLMFDIIPRYFLTM